MLVDSSLQIEDLPQLIVDVPDAAEGIDVSKWCSDTKRILGKQYNVVFRTKDKEDGKKED